MLTWTDFSLPFPVYQKRSGSLQQEPGVISGRQLLNLVVDLYNFLGRIFTCDNRLRQYDKELCTVISV